MKRRLQKGPYRVHLALWVDCCRLAVAFINARFTLCVQYWREWSSNKRSNLFITEFNACVNWNRPATRAGADQASKFRGIYFRLDFGSQVSLPVDYCKPNGVYLTIKQWTAKWPYIVNAVSEMQKKHGEKSNFSRFQGERSPQSPPLDPPLNQSRGQTGPSKPLMEFLCITLDFHKNVMLIYV